MKTKLSMLAITILLACAGPGAAYATDEIPDSIPFELSPEAQYALEEDARRYASTSGITPDQARGRFMAQMGSAELIGKLRETNKNRLAGIYTDYSSGNRIVVRLKGGGTHVRKKTVRVGDEIVTVEFRPGAPYTLAELDTALEAGLPALIEELPTLQGGYADERTGEVALQVLASDLARRPLAANLLGDFPVRMDVLTSPLAQQAMGGGTLGSPTCTSSYSVKETSTGTLGITTAAHCSNSLSSYSGADGAATLTFKAESYNASNDYQWHTASNTSQPKFVYQKSGTTFSTRTLTGRRLQSSTSVGNNLCHYGATSNYSCGDVTSTSYRPTWSCNGVTCNATFVSVGPPASGTGLACAGGDSGGPWFVSTVAAGIHSGGSSAAPCQIAIYMSTDRFSTLGLELVFGP